MRANFFLQIMRMLTLSSITRGRPTSPKQHRAGRYALTCRWMGLRGCDLGVYHLWFLLFLFLLRLLLLLLSSACFHHIRQKGVLLPPQMKTNAWAVVKATRGDELTERDALRLVLCPRSTRF